MAQEALTGVQHTVAADFLRIYVIWAPGSTEGLRLAELVSEHFDGLGMERDGVAVRVPVRYRSDPWDADGIRPRAIDLGQAAHNVAILLHDGFMHEDDREWNAYVAELRNAIDARAGQDLYIPFASPDRDPPLPSDAARHTQYARRDLWSASLPDREARDARFLLQLVFTIRRHLKGALGGGDEDEPLFVSHAKVDGDDVARAIVDYVNDTGHDVPLETFYDAMELVPGADYESRFRAEIGRGTLLAVVSDIYDSRPWCVFELTTAKRERRPIVLADVGRIRTGRTYPYGANLPKVRVTTDLARTAWIEILLVHTLSEGLRCDLFQAQARRRLEAVGIGGALVLPRPPELFDLIDREDLEASVVYPDPPLGLIEAELLGKALRKTGRDVVLRTLSEVR